MMKNSVWVQRSRSRATSFIGAIVIGMACAGCAGEESEFVLDEEGVPIATDQVTEELFGSYNFLLEVSGVTPDQKTIIGGFRSMSSVGDDTRVIVFDDGTSPTGGFAQWAGNGALQKRSGTITVLDQDLNTVVSEIAFEDGYADKLVPQPGGIARLRLVVADVEEVD